MGKNTSVALGDYFETFVEGRVKEGRYKNVSEVVRAGLRLLEAEENQFVALKNQLLEGLESRVANDFDTQSHLQKLKSEKKTHGNFQTFQ